MNNQIVTFSAKAELEGNTISGFAHVFGQRAHVRDHIETFSKGAFDAALAKSDVRAFYQHNPSMLLGRQSAGTLRLTATDEGLAYEIDLPDTSYGNDVKELIRRGDLSEMSFGFIPDQFKWGTQEGVRTRNHTSVRELIDVSPVSIPAFSGTSIQMRGKYLDNESVRSQLIRARQRLIKGEVM